MLSKPLRSSCVSLHLLTTILEQANCVCSGLPTSVTGRTKHRGALLLRLRTMLPTSHRQALWVESSQLQACPLESVTRSLFMVVLMVALDKHQCTWGVGHH